MERIYRLILGRTFSFIFIGLSVGLIGLAVYQFIQGVLVGEELIKIILQSINTTVISLAMFELGVGVSEEYAVSNQQANIFTVLRRTITRFVGLVCIALVLEALILVIKYSQLELAGNLYYPVGILIGASTLLIALGTFLKLTKISP
ncbi:hypothetical protein [Nitrosococcus wardiae]|uniref:Uncharacterized protein n=1 Tax=Nitrosococcus wardiae TaxID=1814290 RepID=A0A4P7C404_9GAMM|nr:hypothetical protein [Nitrosococcus wardiae]QBQ55696.1 hypothetical protein E3U44_15155 [Nitrosococcus wardiae]